MVKILFIIDCESPLYLSVNWPAVPRVGEIVTIINHDDPNATRGGWASMAVKSVKWQRDGRARVLLDKKLDSDQISMVIGGGHGWQSAPDESWPRSPLREW